MNVSKACRAIVASTAALLATLAHAQGVSSREIVLGQSVYLTGALAELGNDFTNGANAYFSKVNASGGVHGRKIRVITMDDAYDPKKALANVDELERQGAFALFQFAGTGTVHEVSTVAASRQIPLVAAVATGPRLRAAHNPYTWYVRAGNTEELEAIIDHLATIGHKRVATVYVDSPYGLEAYEAMQSIIARKSGSFEAGRLVAAVAMKTNGDGAEAAATQLRDAAPQAVVMITVPASSKAFISAAKRAGLRSTLYSLSAGLPVGALRELGGEAHGVIVSQVMPSANRAAIPVVREYQQAYLGAGFDKFTSASLEGYINAKVMVEALTRAGRNLTRAGLVQALDSMSSYDMGGYKVRFSNTAHGGSRAVELTIIGSGGGQFIY
ncbi:hypothetical protein ASC87_13750 [Rhizobacter sp. Root1221]|nr:hypothetical protein ASC87_13750 [Rhizobacter sp. Root1221]